jgi:hypothetical protein
MTELTQERLTPFEQMRAKEARLTAEEVRQLLDYDPEIGWFTWKPRPENDGSVMAWNSRWAGKRAGTLRPSGYRRIGIKGREYLEHRLAVLIINGAWPTDEVDHRNPEAPGDNRWAQLRPATRNQNQANCRSHNRTGFKGVYHEGKRFGAQIRYANKTQYLGNYVSPELAHSAYAKAARELHGDFARLQWRSRATTTKWRTTMTKVYNPNWHKGDQDAQHIDPGTEFENHQDRVEGYHGQIGGVHGNEPGNYRGDGYGENSADAMSRAGQDSLRIFGIVSGSENAGGDEGSHGLRPERPARRGR